MDFCKKATGQAGDIFSSLDTNQKYALGAAVFAVMVSVDRLMQVLLLVVGIVMPLCVRSDRDWLPYWRLYGVLCLLDRPLSAIVPFYGNLKLFFLLALVNSSSLTEVVHRQVTEILDPSLKKETME